MSKTNEPAFTNDELDEEAAWCCLEQNGWIAVPQLLFALKDLIREKRLNDEDTQRQLHLSTLILMSRRI